MSEAVQKMTTSGAQELLGENTRKKAEGMMSPEQAEAYRDYLAAEAYRSFAYKRRESKSISATLKEAQPVLEIEPGILDKDWFLLCTPNGTYDLRKGLDGLREHSPNDFITKMTAYAPSDKGAEIWQDALNTFFCGDQALIRYVQRVAGIVCVGQVFQEAMIIAYGDGRNGKSTFWNTLSRVMGSYSGNISADTLTMNCKRNVKPEMAETKGKRLMIAAELEEGTRLNTSMQELEKYRAQYDHAIVALGNNSNRMRYHGMLESLQYYIPALIHPTAYVSPDAQLAPGCIIRTFAVVGRYAQLGKATILNIGAKVDHHCIIGEGCHLLINAVVRASKMVDSLTWVEAGRIIQ